MREARAKQRASTMGLAGDPKATRAAILKVVDAEEPPLRIFFGRSLLGMVQGEYARRLDTWQQWNEVSEEAHGTPS